MGSGGSRSGSLERRRSGEDSPVLNQSTVHGIASPNRRPTIFDVFRPRAKSDAKRYKDKHLLDPSSADSSATSSTYSVSGGAPATAGAGATSSSAAAASAAATATGTNAGAAGATGAGAAAGGIMNSMKVAMQHFGHRQHPAVTITNADGTSAKSKYKDGSAHLHQGSDAQVWQAYIYSLYCIYSLLFSLCSTVLPHGDGCATTCECQSAFANDQSDGSVSTSFELGGQRGGQTQSGKCHD